MSKKLLPIILAFLMLLGLTGCGGTSSDVKTACQTFFDAYTAGDVDEAGSYLVGGFASGELTSMQSALAKRTEAKVGKITEHDDSSATAAMKITSVDFAALIKACPEDINSSDAALDYLLTAINDSDTPTVVFEVDVPLVLEDGGWKIQMTPELSNALLGGYNTYVDAMLEEVTK